jgi:copper chaperone CopZ
MAQKSCVETITQAVHRVDPSAHVVADIHSKRVVIGSISGVEDFTEAIANAGFTVKAAG